MNRYDTSRRSRLLGAIAASAAILLAACGGGASPAPSAESGASAPASAAAATTPSAAATPSKVITIGALYLDNQGFYGGIKKGIETGAAKAGANVKLLAANSGGDAAKEAQFMGTLIGAKVDAIIMSPVSVTASVPFVKQAFEAGIPIICYNTCINAADAAKYVTALVTTDNQKFGSDVGSWAGDYFIKLGMTNPKIALLNADTCEVCVQRKTGFKTGLQGKVPGVQFVADQTGYVADAAASTTQTILTAHPDINGFWAVNEGGTIGAVQGIKASNKTGQVVVFGLDMDSQIAGFLINGPTLVVTNAQDPQGMGSAAVQIALQLIAGQKPSQYTVTVPTTLYPANDKTAINQWLTAHADGLP